MSVLYHKPANVVWPVPNRSSRSREELLHRIKAISPNISHAMACEAVDRLEDTRVRLARRAREARLEASCSDPDAF
jgi:hypothetical protein